jgi:3-phenylpropionate/cinnamic acid dioxygenase small subunit
MDSSRSIENLLYTYAERIDMGDLEGVAELFRDAVITSPTGGESRGYEAVLSLYQTSTRLYADNNTPHTKHVTTNPIIELQSDTAATCRSYFTVFQSLPDFPIQPIISGRYHDEFEKADGVWRFKKRTMLPELFGDLSQHLLFDASDIQ